MNTNKKYIKMGGLALVVIIVFGWTMSSYNGFVGKDEQCKSQWSKVQVQYQRRMDLIPNLVSTVKGYATHESSTLEKVIAARNKALNTPSNEASSAQYEKAQSTLTSAIRDINVVVERYPELKANENFLALQSQLEGTENRIAVERKRYAELVQEYNRSVRVFPKSIIASIFSFNQKEYYQAEASAEQSPKVAF
ncbi:MAG: LemA family protein [Bacteroidota bacterium]|nr:LemA family protein [Bacteroidota bacterium]